MTDDHFSRETLERFLRLELSREETRGFVRHLLRRCPQCSRLLQEVSQRDNFQLLLRGLEDAALRTDPDREEPPHRQDLDLPQPGEVQAGTEGDAKRRGRLGRS